MVDRTPAQIALAAAEAMLKKLVARRPETETFEAAFRGEHGLAFASKEWAKEHSQRFKGFSDNWCGVVGSAPGERTELFGFRIGEDGQALSDDEKQLWRDWELNEGPAQSSQGFLTSTIARRSAVFVWGDKNDEPVMTWEHPSQVYVEYDAANPRLRLAAIKSWTDEDAAVERLMYQTPTEVWKWSRPIVAGSVVNGRTSSGLYVVGGSGGFGGSMWVPYAAPDDDVWPLPNPLGRVSIVEFQNRPMLGGEPLSDIAGTLSMQHAANLFWAYTFSAADWTSMPGRVVMGQEPPKMPILDTNGQKIGEQALDIEALKNGRMLWLTGQNAKIGQWDAAKLDVFTDVINIMVRHIAAQTRTPIYLVHGELGNVNGDTLLGLDAPLVSKVVESQKFYTSPLREVFSLMALVRDNRKVSEAARTGAIQWRNPAIRTDSQISDAAVKDKQIGWSFAGILEKRYGLSQPEIQRQIEMVRDEQTDPWLMNLAAKDQAASNVEPAAVG